jgi:acetamidase/formamidase
MRGRGFFVVQRRAGATISMSVRHVIPAVPESLVWGKLEAARKPILEVESGDIVVMPSLPAGGRNCLPPDLGLVAPEYLRAIETLPPGPGPHILTGPIALRCARPGDTLQVDILAAELSQDWGFVQIMPLAGILPEEFPVEEIIHPRIDRTGNVAHLPWGATLPLDPFFGVLAVAPPPHWGACTSVIPRSFGGNMDNKALKPGATLYLPIYNDGALFYAGDGHGVQGDGEVCVSALETGLVGTFRLTVRRDMEIACPFAESASHLISIGMDEDLDDAARIAVREMIRHVCARTNLSRSEAYMLCSLMGDLHVTQVVDVHKGAHMTLAKNLL